MSWLKRSSPLWVPLVYVFAVGLTAPPYLVDNLIALLLGGLFFPLLLGVGLECWIEKTAVPDWTLRWMRLSLPELHDIAESDPVLRINIYGSLIRYPRVLTAALRPLSPERAAQEIVTMLGRANLPRPLRRILWRRLRHLDRGAYRLYQQIQLGA